MDVLIIDDAQINVTLLQHLVTKLTQCTPITFTDPVAALAWCMDNEPDLVVVDYMMPLMNGTEFTEKFRVRHPDIPVLMVTSNCEPELRYRAFVHGVTDFLNKPLDRVEFLARTKHMLELRQSSKNRLASLVAIRRASLGTLAGGIAHDFNNQMAMIMGYVEILKATIDNPQAQKTLNSILQVLDRSASMVSKLSAFGSTEEEDELKYFCLATLLHDDYKLLLPIFVGIKLTINPISGYNALDNTPEAEQTSRYGFYGDRSDFSQIVTNLCVNAKHAMSGRKDGHIQFNLERVEEEGCLRLQIIDNGSGMPPDVLANIFEPYYTTKPVGEGSGLGLFMVQGMITRMGGEIICESEMGKGTVFTITLPIANKL